MLSSNDQKKFFELSGLRSGFLAGTLSEKQQEELNSWLAENERHRELFEHICARQTMRSKIHRYHNEEVQAAFQNFMHRRQRLAFRHRIYQLAVCAVVLIALGGAWLQWQKMRPEQAGKERLVLEDSRQDSTARRPVLTLASGMQIVIPESGLMPGEAAHGRQAAAKDGIFGQQTDIFSPAGSGYNTVNVPPMCDFHFTLADGTKVWMNANSYLRYPVQFAADSRTIYVSGEVYLEVAKDNRRPFSVMVEGMKIEVLGTCFNVRAYSHENETRVTLAEGKVAARVGEETYTLTPGNQLSLEEKTGGVAIRTVDVDDVLAWKRGFYVFKKCNLAEVALTLQCWYNVEIVLKGKVAAHTTYTGVVNKEETIDVFLSRLEKVSDVKCSRKGNVVSIQ